MSPSKRRDRHKKSAKTIEPHQELVGVVDEKRKVRLPKGVKWTVRKRA